MKTRQEFIKQIARFAALGGLLTLAGAILFKKGDKSLAECGIDVPCSSCKKFKTCTLPEKQS